MTAVIEPRDNRYQPRFVDEEGAKVLMFLYHQAKFEIEQLNVSLRHPHRQKMMDAWHAKTVARAANEFHKMHPQVSALGAKKDLLGLLGKER